MIGYTVSALQISANRRAAFLLAQALSIPVTHSFASANFQDLRNGEVVRRIHLLGGWVNKASAWASSVAVLLYGKMPVGRGVSRKGYEYAASYRAVGDVMAAALVDASGVTHLRFRVLQ